MTDWNSLIAGGDLPFNNISTASDCCLGFYFQCSSTSAPASNIWPTASTALFAPFFINAPFTMTQMYWYNGATVSGNVDVGIYDNDLNRIISSGSTLGAGINAPQTVNPTDVTLNPGNYFLALSVDNITATMFQYTINAAVGRSLYLFQMASAFPLPATATISNWTQTHVPIYGITSVGSITV